MIILDPRYHADKENISLTQELLAMFPRPINSIATTIESHEQHRLRLQELCLSLIPLTFQYIALVLSSEYFSTDLPPASDVMDNFMRMIKRPGPGKWVGFIRCAANYFKDKPCRVVPTEAIDLLHTSLLAMLDRMAELKKTEISLTEFLQQKKEIKLRGKKKHLDLEKIIYDPRSNSSYKKLLEEGLIEERTAEKNGENEERLTFAQEKISTMLDREHNTQQLKRSLRRFCYLVLVVLAFFGLVLFKKGEIAEMTHLIQELLSECTLPAAEIQRLQTQLIMITKLHFSHYIVILFIMFSPIYLFYLLTIIAILIRRVRAKWIVQDLPTLYTSQKFARIRDRYVGRIMVIGILLYFTILGFIIPVILPMWRSVLHPRIFINSRSLLLFFALSLLAASVWTILHHYRVSEDTNALLGKRAALETGFNITMVFIPLLSLVFLLANLLALVNSKQAATIQAKEIEFMTSSEYQLLEKSPEKNDKKVLHSLSSSIFDKWRFLQRSLDNFIPSFQRAINMFTAECCIVFPLFLVMQWLSAYPVGAYLRRRETVPCD
ncbi:hypothetical protein ACFL27_07905 [candidate division CSSED10-310 bacterium]|uniref:Uncharacterized protein n=1 Tax=candidate division CSSED10-310 bacterium TaxID=2855610 RepID=A0ABV6YV89_UNCC1